jgi:pimeloyl-ACP methyl ester carboxylesterase
MNMDLKDFSLVTGEGLMTAGFEAGAGGALVCVHGLSRNARDFERVAEQLAGPHRHVLAYDVYGRGESSWLPRPELYDFPTYVGQAIALLTARGMTGVDWLGTSMGGLIGLALASSVPGLIRRLILNDVGPFIPTASLQGMRDAAVDPNFSDMGVVEQVLRQRHADFGPIDDAGWRRMAETSVRPREGGGWRLHFDPAIYNGLKTSKPADVVLWDLWAKLPRDLPVLVLRGETSALLPRATALGMVASRPGVTLAEIPQCGHAPSLYPPDQIRVIADWLALA